MKVNRLIADILADLKSNRLKLPTLPQIALKINDITDSPEATTKRIADVMSTDMALTTRIIQVANSPLVRASTPVDNIQTAITRMGIGMVRNVVTSFLLRQLFHTRHNTLRKRIHLLWNHSVHVAAISHVLTNHHTNLKPDTAMLAGLIHDIGKLPLIAKAEDNPELANNDKLMDTLAEKLHTSLGKVIVQTWRFTPEYITTVAEHENLQRDSETLDVTDVVSVANLLSYAGKDHPLTRTDWTTVPAFKKLGISPEDSITTLKEARDEITEIVKLLTT